jgi:hypothetical protein
MRPLRQSGYIHSPQSRPPTPANLALIRIFDDFLTAMASEEPIAANRRNALQTSGANTPEGRVCVGFLLPGRSAFAVAGQRVGSRAGARQ